MNIAFISSDSKKELMAQLCIAYKQILGRNNLCATSATGKYISDATGLEIQRLMSGNCGGLQQIISRLSCGEIDFLIFFRDPLRSKDAVQDEIDILRLCDVHNIPLATNMATAEALIHALDNGDLDWRLYVIHLKA